ncbi:MAG: c-type cytochrome [Longimicrobiales bacterium]
MWSTNLKILAIVLGTLAAYTLLANSIPQVESEVPQELSFGSNVTPEQLATAGEQLYNGAGGCTACHGLGTRAPNLLTDDRGAGAIGARCGNRQSGVNCKLYLHESLVQPNKFVVEGFQPIMPDLSRTLSTAQIWSLVAFLQSTGGEITVTADDVASARGTPPAPAPAPTGTASTDPQEIMRANQCLACHKVGSEGAPVGPDLSHIGARADAAYLRRAILDPDRELAKGFESLKGIMPKTFGNQLTAAQLEAVVDYLVGLK